MPKYIVERKVKGMGLSSQSEMQMMAQKSNEALNELEGKVMWLESFVTDDASYCIYVAPNEELIRRHAQMAGFPADRISKIDMVIDPSTGESAQMPNMASREKGYEKPLTQ